MIEAELAYAFTVGMVATVNPCGFALLPAYLSYFLGLEGARSDSRASVLRALGVALVVTSGFVAVFGALGLAITQLSLSINRQLPWLTIGIGIALMVLGIAMLRGFQLTVRLPKVPTGSVGRELSSMFVFGISYAVASLSCTLPIFLPLMTRTFETSNLASGIAAFLTYAAGMGVLLAVITVALALARGAIVNRLRSAQPYINRVSGALILVAGAYLTYYGWWEHRVLSDPRNAPPAGPVATVTDLTGRISDWLTSVGAVRVGVVLAGVLAIALILVLGQRRTPLPLPPDEIPSGAGESGR